MADQQSEDPCPCPNIEPHASAAWCQMNFITPNQELSVHCEQTIHSTSTIMDKLNPIDPWAAPATQAFAFIGVLWVSYKIFSFWRLIASLFILPGQSVCFTHPSLDSSQTDTPPALQVR